MKNFISINLSLLICLGLGVFLQSSCAQKGRKVSNSALTVVDSSDYFTNPVGKGADPWVVKDNGFYYVCQVAETKRGEGISIRKSSFLTKLGKRQVVWTAPKNAWNSTSVWAPELHHIGNRWYIYYTAGKSGPPYTFQRSGVLESVTDDPMGEYVDKAS
jgi:GH43 family beta-xylosidase